MMYKKSMYQNILYHWLYVLGVNLIFFKDFRFDLLTFLIDFYYIVPFQNVLVS